MSNKPNLIKELREKTGAGILDCKNALLENNNDIIQSIDWLRKKGLSTASKKSNRIAAEGLVAVNVLNERSGVIIEVNSETDFVSRNNIFQDFVKNCSIIASKSNYNLDELLASSYLNTGKSVKEELIEKIAAIGENLNIRRLVSLEISNPGFIVSYVHNTVSNNLGKIGVLVAFETEIQNNEVKDFGKHIAMHIAATNPLSVNIEGLDPLIIKNEKQILLEQTISSGKPSDIAEKIVEGRIKKFYQENILNEQIFVVDGKTKINSLLNDFSKKYGKDIKILGFKKIVLGEGIEVEQKDFASEVAATVKK